MFKINNRLQVVALLIILISCLSVFEAKADSGFHIDLSGGGVITPGDKTEDIEMVSEKVIFNVKDNNGIFQDSIIHIDTDVGPSGELDLIYAEIKHYTHVSASFMLRNTSDQTIDQKIFFPFYKHRDYFDEYDITKVKNVSVKINNETVAYQIDNDYSDYYSALFDVSFLPGTETQIDVEYDLRFMHKSKSDLWGFEYFMETGSHWSGDIGSGEMIIEFDNFENLDDIKIYSSSFDKYVVENRKVIWRFEELEPTSDDNIEVYLGPIKAYTYLAKPEDGESIKYTIDNELDIILDVGRNLYRKVMQNAADPLYNIKFESSGECHMLSSNYGMSIVSRLFSTDESCDGCGTRYIVECVNPHMLRTDVPDGGYIFDYDSDSESDWLKFTWKRDKQIVKSVNIRTGILNKQCSSSCSLVESTYDTFKRPKEIEIVLSNGMSHRVTLADLPDQYQEIVLPEDYHTPISDLTINIISSYQGVGENDKYLGLGRIDINTDNFNGTNNFPTSDPLSDTNEGDVKQEKSTNSIVIIIGIIVGILIIGGLLYFYLKKNKHLPQ